MAKPHNDRNMLLGILALQMDFISRDQLITAMNSWVLDKTRQLDGILLDQGHLQPDTRELLTALIEKHLEMHGGDAGKSLASLSSIGSVRVDLESIADAEIDATLTIVSANREVDDSHEAAVRTVGMATSTGTRFRILRPHAKGGLGHVSVALDSELNREVAVKEIQERHADSEESRTRFVMEAEITGGLEHPGIVPVYGLGSYADGRPYYAMRFIKGDSLQEAIDRYHQLNSDGHLDASQSALEVRQLLGRFVDVCQAIEYAHSRGVLHRDLKPGNIMLGKYGETLVVDWGLAKLKGREVGAKSEGETSLKPRSGSGTAPTQMGSAIGTPAFMSPEQASGQLAELGPVSDVYSLGATLYCLLTGRAPFRGSDLGTTLRRVQTGDFPLPHEIKPDLAKPLEAICLKAMAKEPASRYASPRELGDDVERWLADEPVRAWPEPLLVRARRWFRRHHKLTFSAAATVLAALVSLVAILTVVTSTNQKLANANAKLDIAIEALTTNNQELERANAAERLAKKDAETKRGEAETARDETEQVLEYIVNAFRKPDPNAEGEKLTVAELLDQAVQQLDQDFTDAPLIRARLCRAIGRTYRGLGIYDRSRQAHEMARNLRREQLGEEHLKTLISSSDLIEAHRLAGQVNQAVQLGEDTLSRLRKTVGEKHRETIMTIANLAVAYKSAGQTEKAIPLYEESADLLRDTMGNDHPDTLTAMSNLASAYQRLGRLEEAIPLMEVTLERRRSRLGEDHPETLQSMNNLADALRSAGRLKEALPLIEATVKAMRAKLGEDHPHTLMALNNLASVHFSENRLEEAAELFEQLLEKRLAKLGEDHPHTLMSKNNLAVVYIQLGQPQKARPLLEETVKRNLAKLGPDHPHTLQSTLTLGVVCGSLGDLETAVKLHQEVLNRWRARYGDEHQNTLMATQSLAGVYLSAGKPTEAIPLYEESLGKLRAKLGNNHSDTLTTLHNLAKAYEDAERYADAEPLRLEVAEHYLQESEGAQGAERLKALKRLVDLYAAWKKPNEAAKWQAKLND